MSTLRLKFGCGDYDRTRPIVDGPVKIEGTVTGGTVIRGTVKTLEMAGKAGEK